MVISRFPNINALLKRFHFVTFVVRQFLKDNCLQIAAALTYITILSLVPIVAISLSVLSSFETSQEAVLRFIFQYLLPTPSLREIVLVNIQAFAQKTATLSVIGGLFLIVTSVSLLNTAEEAFNRIWGVTERRPLMHKLTSFWSVITLCPVLFAAGLILSSKLAMSPLLGDILRTSFAKLLHQHVLPALLTFLAISIIYLVLPHTRVPFRGAMVGALIATALFQVARWGFAIYIAHFSEYEKIYGMLGILPVFFLWLYVSWVILFLGAEICYALEFEKVENQEEGFTQEPYDSYHALRIMLAIGRKFSAGEGAVSRSDLEAALRIPHGLLMGIVKYLRDKDIVYTIDRGGEKYVPSRSLDRITVREVVDAVRGDPFFVPGSSERDLDGRLIRNFFGDVRNRMQNVWKEMTIQDLLGTIKESRTRARRGLVPKTPEK